MRQAIKKMYLIEILLPLRDNDGHPFHARDYQSLRDQLTDHFGGITAFTRTPAEGETRDAGGKCETRSSSTRL
jgi:hypothetical protein